ncbi:MAG: hypothetical protein JXA20_14145 [Spirochaetes bacterium]|nr:hypothetical protein [Spirochaetota bacterium]
MSGGCIRRTMAAACIAFLASGTAAGSLYALEGGAVPRHLVESNPTFDITARGHFIVPCGTLGEMFDTGYGATLSVALRHCGIDHLAVGLQSGYFSFDPDHFQSQSLEMVPMLVTVRYDYLDSHVDFLEISPIIAGGCSYTVIEYTVFRGFAGETYPVTGRKSEFEPLILLGAELRVVLYGIGGTVALNAGAQWGWQVESGDLVHFVSITAGLELRL